MARRSRGPDPDSLTDAGDEAAWQTAAALRSMPELTIQPQNVAAGLVSRRSSADDLTRLFACTDIGTHPLWASIAAAGDVDALRARFIALRRALAWADAHGLMATAADWHLARIEIAHRHGYRTWDALQRVAGASAPTWSALERAAGSAALGKAVRAAMFGDDTRTIRTERTPEVEAGI